jgi:hypothetical protein
MNSSERTELVSILARLTAQMKQKSLGVDYATGDHGDEWIFAAILGWILVPDSTNVCFKYLVNHSGNGLKDVLKLIEISASNRDHRLCWEECPSESQALYSLIRPILGW